MKAGSSAKKVVKKDKSVDLVVEETIELSVKAAKVKKIIK
jgi:hypothetical protein